MYEKSEQESKLQREAADTEIWDLKEANADKDSKMRTLEADQERKEKLIKEQEEKMA